MVGPSGTKKAVVTRMPRAPVVPPDARPSGIQNKTDHPNHVTKRLLQLSSGNKSRAKHNIINTFQQPEYTARDIEIRDGVWKVMGLMERFTKAHIRFELNNIVALKKVFNTLKPETGKIIGCVASGGPGGEDGWYDLFTNEPKRCALVVTIIGNVLMEQVFQHAFFGGKEAQKELLAIQKQYQREDGFVRNIKYAQHIRASLGEETHRGQFSGKIDLTPLPLSFHIHVKEVILAIYKHLLPILSLNPSFTSNPAPTARKPVLGTLYTLVGCADAISTFMRLDPHTVYYFTPILKEKKMQTTHPRRRTSWPEEFLETNIARAKHDERVVEITLIGGVTAYRQGGWETQDSGVEEGTVKYVDENGKEKGIRSRVLTQSWVHSCLKLEATVNKLKHETGEGALDLTDVSEASSHLLPDSCPPGH
ncbi:uncharacterized protein BDR25DRAFT_310461 [Lindgomyces ingoldianus]|uniref:Uncharacterized protein n=1 Tax=Lindgomyces ingoldianus TaxID=673940 RepID=A0ACB6R9R3_9PLEO|nr:uncharacterized protein BDR25DRAFT_310461 [Lindgomyces ingoldianus]KAF2476059.1 hypothetical protein BDR25DRAFT_310461 [Lindgomyces ingoldianus]